VCVFAFVLTTAAAPLLAQTSAPPQPHPHGGHGSDKQEGRPQQPADHSAHRQPAEQTTYPPFIPELSDEDRAAAFPKLNGQHAVHDEGVHYFVLFDQLEWQGGSGGNGFSWDNKGWIGKDIDRFWFRTEGEAEDGDLGSAQVHAFYGRALARWWDLVAGIRQDMRPGPARTWAALGIQGLAPYWFEVEATAYFGEGGRTHLRLETEYELLLTNRLILQPLVEIELYGKEDPERGLGAGLSTIESGLRLRYEFRREFAPYIGVALERTFFGTRDLARAHGDATGGTRLVLGIRTWF
jgi:copper resistance protein B